MAGNYGDVPQLLKEQQQRIQQQQQMQQQMQQQQQQQHQVMPQQQMSHQQQQQPPQPSQVPGGMAQNAPRLHHPQMPIPTPQNLPTSGGGGIQPHQLAPPPPSQQQQQQQRMHQPMSQFQPPQQIAGYPPSHATPSTLQQQQQQFQAPLHHPGTAGPPIRGLAHLQRTPLPPAPQQQQQQQVSAPQSTPATIPQQQQQQAFQSQMRHPMPAPTNSTTSIAQSHDQNTSKEINTFRFCTIGMQLVHEIIQRSTEMFACIKTMHLPNGLLSNQPSFADKRQKFIEHRENLILDFRKLRIIYDKVSNNTSSYASEDLKSILPIMKIDPGDEDAEQPAETSVEIEDSAEIKIYREQLKIKNGQLKISIDEMRSVIFEINAMLDMKR